MPHRLPKKSNLFTPASIAGAIAEAIAEVLAGLIYVNAMSPRHPTIARTWPFVSDLRTGSMSGDSGEQRLWPGLLV